MERRQGAVPLGILRDSKEAGSLAALLGEGSAHNLVHTSIRPRLDPLAMSTPLCAKIAGFSLHAARVVISRDSSTTLGPAFSSRISRSPSSSTSGRWRWIATSRWHMRRSRSPRPATRRAGRDKRVSALDQPTRIESDAALILLGMRHDAIRGRSELTPAGFPAAATADRLVA